jgi:uncharacterized protein (DUF1499 family)
MKVVIFALVLISFVSCSSSTPQVGMIGDKLRPCPEGSSNCVVTFYKEEQPDNYFPPYKADNIQAVRQQLRYYLSTKREVKVITVDPQYLHATFESDFFGFIDDFEAYFDGDNKLLHMRSASRSGSSDFGVNRERLQTIQRFLLKQY